MDLSRLIGGGKYLKRLSQAKFSDTYNSMAAGQWITVLELTGKHQIELLTATGNTNNSYYIKYVVDGVESVEIPLIQYGLKKLIIGLGYVTSNTDSIDADMPCFCKNNFKILIKALANTVHNLGVAARYSQVAVEDME
jgi:hypothetical protein